MILAITLILLGMNYLVAVGIGIGMLMADAVSRDDTADSDIRVIRWVKEPEWPLMIREGT